MYPPPLGDNCISDSRKVPKYKIFVFNIYYDSFPSCLSLFITKYRPESHLYCAADNRTKHVTTISRRQMADSTVVPDRIPYSILGVTFYSKMDISLLHLY